MNKKSFFVFLLFLFSFSAFSQRHLKGLKGVEINGGTSGIGKYGQIGYSQYVSNKLYIKGLIGLEKGSFKGIKFNSHNIEIGGYYSPLAIKKTIFFNLTAGATGFLERITNFEVAKKNRTGFGPYAGVEIETYISNKIIFLLNAKQKYIIHEKLNGNRNKDYFFAGAGIKFIIN